MELFDNAKKIVDCVCGELRRLTEYNFEAIAYHGTSEQVYVNKSLGVVVKRSYLSTREIPDCIIPTMIVDEYPVNEEDRRSREYRDCSDRIFIQPLADCSWEASERAYIALRDQTRKDFDTHSGNFGIYEGRPVMIDW